MEPTKSTFAAITDYNFRTTSEPVTDEQDAVEKTLAANGIYFQTYEVSSVTLGGKELKGEPENFSPRRWVGIDRVYTRDEVIQSMQADMGREKDSLMKGVMKTVIGHYKSMPADSMHITGIERPGEFTDIGKDEKVFDRSGQQIWPPAPPSVSVNHAVKPLKKIQLKPGR